MGALLHSKKLYQKLPILPHKQIKWQFIVIISICQGSQYWSPYYSRVYCITHSIESTWARDSQKQLTLRQLPSSGKILNYNLALPIGPGFPSGVRNFTVFEAGPLKAPLKAKTLA